MFEALLGLFIKHFICDFPLQMFPWLYKNKGKYLHPGGIVHASLHGIGTMIVLGYFLNFKLALFMGLLDLLLHYHIDWAKMNLSRHYNLKPDNSEWFWLLLGFDQFLHHLTYFAIIYYAFRYTS
ncbi:MAG TPA: DUF3307 domain-containing protein [Methylophilaceae bacterium]|nr:DUF3307 domain-containing protein [Methylophilaceae bacterium]